MTAEAVDVADELSDWRPVFALYRALRGGGVFGYIRAPFGHNQAGPTTSEPGQAPGGLSNRDQNQ